jgi:hypothetical protein
LPPGSQPSRPPPEAKARDVAGYRRNGGFQGRNLDHAVDRHRGLRRAVHQRQHYSGLEVGHDHKRNLYRIIVGEQGIILSKKVDELDAKIRQANTDLNGSKNKIRPHILDALDIEKFVALSKFDKVDELIAKKEEEIAALKNAAEIETKGSFAAVSLPAAPATDILSTTLDNLSEEAAAAVAAHAAALDGRGEIWQANGVDYMKGTTCPFCAQDMF